MEFKHLSKSDTIGSGDYIFRHYSQSSCLCFTANSAASTISSAVAGTISALPTLEYSLDKTNWSSFEIGTTTVSLSIGQSVYLRGDNNTFSVDYNNYIYFVMTGTVYASGSIMTLLDKTDTLRTVPNYAFMKLFYNCNVLRTPPELTATSVGQYAYAYMFMNCSSLYTIADMSHITSIGYLSCDCMYSYCVDLVDLSSMSFPTITAYNCYQGMFIGCTGLIKPPALPATTLWGGCYFYLFRFCTSLESVPKIPGWSAIGGPPASYMFEGCTSLIVSDSQTAEATNSWKIPFSGTGSGYNGENVDMFKDCLGTRSTDSPNFYEVQKEYYTQNEPITPSVQEIDYLCFTADGKTSTVTTTVVGALTFVPTLEYSLNKTAWYPFVIGSTTVSLSDGESMYLRGTNGSFNTNTRSYAYFVMTGEIVASGSIMTLLDKYDMLRVVPEYAFYYLFYNCKVMTQSPDLPAYKISQYGYANMFYNCTHITTIPYITHIIQIGYMSCYQMFASCTRITDLSSVSMPMATGYNCYQEMFMNCTNLAKPPKLPATELWGGCYWYMFQYDRLTYVPAIPQHNAVNGPPFNGMFCDCHHIYISDTQTTEASVAWTIPESGVATGYDGENSYMFEDCLGTRSSDSPNFYGVQITYYTQNTPIS